MSSDYHAKTAAEQERLAEQVRAIEHELRTNPEYQPYFARYRPADVQAFIQQYARRKVRYEQKGAERQAALEAQATAVRDLARQRLWDIQQKKLFDLQCRWRSGQLRLPDVQVSEQFAYWSRHPEQCPFLPPITAEEFALYCEYIRSAASLSEQWSGGGTRHVSDWQSYRNLRRVYHHDEHPDIAPGVILIKYTDDDEQGDDDADDDWEDEDEQLYYPAWYRFYDQRHGTGPLRHQPDVRGKREEFYYDLYLKDWASRRRAKQAAPPAPTASTAPDPAAAPPMAPAEPAPVAPPDTRPAWYLNGRDEIFRTVVEQFDPTPQLLELRRAMRDGQEQKYSRENDQALRDFCDLADEHHLIVPIETDAADWRAALRRAVQDLQRRQLLAVLPLEYEEYQERLALHLQPAAPGYGANSYYDDDRELSRITRKGKDVLRGRVLNGEPENFDF